MRELAVPFTEHLLRFGDEPAWVSFRKISPSGKVPCLVDDGTAVADSREIIAWAAANPA